MASPLGYLLTWRTYGTWLPGDARTSVNKHRAAWHMDVDPPDPVKEAAARRRMTEPACLLDEPLRKAVEASIEEVCAYCNWNLRARSCRSNHVHVVVAAGGVDPDTVMTKFKAYATRALKRLAGSDRKNWWAEGGSTRHLNDEESLAKAVRYANQDKEQAPEG